MQNGQPGQASCTLGHELEETGQSTCSGDAGGYVVTEGDEAKWPRRSKWKLDLLGTTGDRRRLTFKVGARREDLDTG